MKTQLTIGSVVSVLVGSVLALLAGYAIVFTANDNTVLLGLMLVLGLGVAFTPKVAATFKAWRGRTQS